MKRLISLWLCFVLVVSSAVVLVGDEDEVVEGKAVVRNGLTYITHAPILIDSDADFGIGINGVIAGDGSISNPWIIENWSIDGSAFSYSIRIENTFDWFIIRNCYVYNADVFGISLDATIRGSLIGNNVISKANGIGLYYSSILSIENNNVSDNPGNGIALWNSRNSKLTNNIVNNNYFNGIEIEGTSWGGDSYGNTLNNNTILNNRIGILIDGYENTLTNNNVSSNYLGGISLSGANNNELYNNTLSLNEFSGIRLDYSDMNVIKNNSINPNLLAYSQDKIGILLLKSEKNILISNSFIIIYN